MSRATNKQELIENLKTVCTEYTFTAVALFAIGFVLGAILF